MKDFREVHLLVDSQGNLSICGGAIRLFTCQVNANKAAQLFSNGVRVRTLSKKEFKATLAFNDETMFLVNPEYKETDNKVKELNGKKASFEKLFKMSVRPAPVATEVPQRVEELAMA